MLCWRLPPRCRARNEIDKLIVKSPEAPSKPQESGAGMPSIVFLIRALDMGGAQRQLAELAAGLHRAGWQVQIVTFHSSLPAYHTQNNDSKTQSRQLV